MGCCGNVSRRNGAALSSSCSVSEHPHTGSAGISASSWLIRHLADLVLFRTSRAVVEHMFQRWLKSLICNDVNRSVSHSAASGPAPRRWRGSRKPSTMSAAAGASSQGASAAMPTCAASCSIAPQLGVGAANPKPDKGKRRLRHDERRHEDASPARPGSRASPAAGAAQITRQGTRRARAQLLRTPPAFH